MPTTNFDTASIKQSIEGKLQRYYGLTVQEANNLQIYRAVASTVRDQIMQKWMISRDRKRKLDRKQVYYLSVEYLLGRSLNTNIINLCNEDAYAQALAELGIDVQKILPVEPDPALGNGGLGRLAACFLDSLASLDIPAMGCTIRYEYGLFRQKIVEGQQVELPDNWLMNGNVWEVARTEDTVTIDFNGRVEEGVDEYGNQTFNLVDTYQVDAVPYDMPVVGYDNQCVNTLRTWSARSRETIDLRHFGEAEYMKAMEEKMMAEVINKVLYPDDKHYEGKMLRLRQQYFFVSATMQYAINRFKKHHGTNWDLLPEKCMFHINDTHPALAIPELMRLLIDKEGLSWDKAQYLTYHCMAYTNHTVMAEALEKWPVDMMKQTLPRIFMILEELNRRLCAKLYNAYPDQWERIGHMAIIGYGQVHMANLCVAYSQSVNGVSQLHGQILKDSLFHDFYTLENNKFKAITNGITHRRWLLSSNPALTNLLTDTIGPGFKHDAAELEKLLPYADDAAFRAEFDKVKQHNKQRLAKLVKERQGIDIDPSFIFDTQSKRLHEYKRQMLNALHIQVLYNRIVDDPNFTMPPRIFFFGAKAAPGYSRAKQIIRYINALSELIEKHPRASQMLKIVYIENYDVSTAEILIPATEISQQISTAGKEASGTGNMKFMMNGAVTLGTMDGANVEMFEQVGNDNIYIFGMRAETVEGMYRERSYNPMSIFENNYEIRKAMTQWLDGTLFPNEPLAMQDLYHTLLVGEYGNMPDSYFVLKDFGSYTMANKRIMDDYLDRDKWLKMAVINTAKSGFFSSDRTINEYNEQICRDSKGQSPLVQSRVLPWRWVQGGGASRLPRVLPSQRRRSPMPFTPAQQAAIDAQNRELLVSAAAGSGKTAVLVERILRMIAQDGMSIERMLIVTFTRAAAGEMRERLELRLSEAANGDERLTRQADLVASAQISTIHSFCQKTVRRYFQHCKIDPQFGLCDERTRAAFWNESMEEVLDWLYAEAKTQPDLASLTAKFDERQIREMLERLYGFLMSRPDPMDWLEKHVEKEWKIETLDEEPMAREFCRESRLIIDGMLSLWRQARALTDSPAFPTKLMATLASDGEVLQNLASACDTGLTVLMECMASLSFVRQAIVKPASTDEQMLLDQFKALRARYKDMVDELSKLLPEDVEQAVADLQRMAPATRGLADTVRHLKDCFAQRKREKAVIDFNDLEHMTLQVLQDPKLRGELCQQFDAIFVDEYQDVSELQEAILNGLKREDGQFTFYVGDVKQSIYRFRLAEPGLFLGKLARFSPEESAMERRISLNRNFRSRTAVLDAVNRVFEHVMDRRVTEIDYDEDAHLVPGIPSENDPVTELHILNADGQRPQDQIMAQAEWIARDILAHVDTARFRDVAILLPVGKNIADKVELALSRAGVPVYCEGGNDAMASEEIGEVMQYLILMDNLMNDVALLSVLRSPLFDMVEDELSQVRLLKPEREASFLLALMHAAKEADEPLRSRCEHIVETLEQERFYLSSMPLGDYLWDFLGRSGLYAHFGAQPGGKLRQANLRMLCHRAAEWEQQHNDGLHGFVEALLLDGGSGETAPTVIDPWADVVRIMTIHKSKGLEFPTVYVMNLERGLFGRPSTSTLHVHGEVGFGLGYVNEEARTHRMTLLQSAIVLRNQNAERAERARVLYVALTRPKSRLVMVGSESEANAGLDAMINRVNQGADVYAVRQANSMLDWLMQCIQPTDLIEQFSTTAPRKTNYQNAFSTVSTGFPQKYAAWKVVFHIDPSAVCENDARMASLPVEIPKVETVEKVQRHVENWTLPMPLKVGVTALCRAIEEGELSHDEETPELKRVPLQPAQPKKLGALPSLPAFLEPPKEERAVQVGVQTHRVLGLIDLDAVRPAADAPKALYAAICREVERMQAQGILTEAEADFVDRRMVARFLESDLGCRMLRSPRVEREWSFNLRITQPFPTIVQGVIDLCFLEDGAWVLADYKTDRVQSIQELWQRYHRQLGFYQEALQKATPYPVKEALLFSLRLGDAQKRPE